MGGKAIANVKRIGAWDYPDFAEHIIKLLSDGDVKPEVIPSYHFKDSHGDLDIIVPSHFWHTHTVDGVASILGATQVVVNGEVASFGVPYQGWLYQMDIVTVPEKVYDFAKSFYSYNVLGELLGVMAKRMGFKYGHHGLFYRLYDADNPTTLIQTIPVTTNFRDAIQFLGYDYDEFKCGMLGLSGLFRFLLSSPYASPEMFQVKHKYKIEFENYCENRNPPTKPELDKATHFLRAVEAFPDFQESVTAAIRSHEYRVRAKEAFNGSLVRDLTGLDGKELGKFMDAFREVTPKEDLPYITPEDILDFFHERKG